MLLYNKSRYKRKHKKGIVMRIKVQGNTKTSKVYVRNTTAQKRVERQLNDILAIIRETNNKLRELK